MLNLAEVYNTADHIGGFVTSAVVSLNVFVCILRRNRTSACRKNVKDFSKSVLRDNYWALDHTDKHALADH